MHPNPILTAAIANLAGQDLTVLVAVALPPDDDQAIKDLKLRPLAIDLFNEALDTSSSVHAPLCRVLATVLDADEPIAWFPVTAQMTAGTSGDCGFPDEVLGLNRWDRDASHRMQSHLFPPAASPRDDLQAIDRLTHEWLNLFLLDLGARGFEAELSRCSRRAT